MSGVATKLSTSLTACSWLLLVSLGARGQVVHDLPKLINSSDVVAVARVAAVSETGSGTVDFPGGRSIPAHFRVATLHLQDVLKGEPASMDIALRYTILYSPGGWGGGVPQGYTIRDTLVPNSTRIVFLKSVGEHYEFSNGSYLSVICAPESSSSDQSPDIFRRVLSRLTEAIFSASLSQQDKAEAIRQLGAVDTNSVIPALRTFIAGDVGQRDEVLRTEAIVALLGHKDDSVVGLAESELLTGSSAYWKSNLLFALTRAVPPSRSIPLLAKGPYIACRADANLSGSSDIPDQFSQRYPAAAVSP